jgi:uncharacterized membrane protein
MVGQPTLEGAMSTSPPSTGLELGPVQIVVIGLGEAELVAELVPELRRLRKPDGIRLIDLVLLHKDESGRLLKLDVARCSAAESAEFGDAADALVGAGAVAELGLWVGAGAGAGSGLGPVDATQAWAVSDAIPPGTTAAVLLLEHRWAIPLRSAVVRAGGFALEDTWVRGVDLIATGAALPTR